MITRFAFGVSEASDFLLSCYDEGLVMQDEDSQAQPADRPGEVKLTEVYEHVEQRS